MRRKEYTNPKASSIYYSQVSLLNSRGQRRHRVKGVPMNYISNINKHNEPEDMGDVQL